jgi:hypothetical protein
LIGYTRLAPRPNPTTLSTGFPQYLWKIQEKTGKALRRLSVHMNLQKVKNESDFEANRLISLSRSVKRQGTRRFYPQASNPTRNLASPQSVRIGMGTIAIYVLGDARYIRRD